MYTIWGSPHFGQTFLDKPEWTFCSKHGFYTWCGTLCPVSEVVETSIVEEVSAFTDVNIVDVWVSARDVLTTTSVAEDAASKVVNEELVVSAGAVLTSTTVNVEDAASEVVKIEVVVSKGVVLICVNAVEVPISAVFDAALAVSADAELLPVNIVEVVASTTVNTAFVVPTNGALSSVTVEVATSVIALASTTTTSSAADGASIAADGFAGVKKWSSWWGRSNCVKRRLGMDFMASNVAGMIFVYRLPPSGQTPGLLTFATCSYPQVHKFVRLCVGESFLGLCQKGWT